MKKNILSISANKFFAGKILFVAVIGLLILASCDEAVKDDILAVPSNVGITVEGRWVTVSWDAVPNASGYEVYTDSEGCPSGRRISNTATHTFTNHDGDALSSTYPTNGSVEFHGTTSIKVWLMADTADNTAAMASSVSAKVKAISTNSDYLDSDYSAEISVSKSQYQAGTDTGSTDDDDHSGHDHDGHGHDDDDDDDGDDHGHHH